MRSDVITTLAYLGIPSAVTVLCFSLLKARIDKRDKNVMHGKQQEKN